MIQLTAVRLLNWYHFVDETLRLTGSLLLLGDNGSGKTSILEAIQWAPSPTSPHVGDRRASRIASGIPRSVDRRGRGAPSRTIWARRPLSTASRISSSVSASRKLTPAIAQLQLRYERREMIWMSTPRGSEEQLLAKIRRLPPQKAAEVEDFVDFLRQRYEDERLTRAAAKLSEDAFARVWDSADDADYDRL